MNKVNGLLQVMLHRFTYRLKTLLLLFSIIVVLLGYFVNRMRWQEQLCRELREREAAVVWSNELPDGHLDAHGVPWPITGLVPPEESTSPPWMAKLFRTIRFVDFNSDTPRPGYPTSEDVAIACKCSSLEGLVVTCGIDYSMDMSEFIDAVPIGDADLAQIAKLKQIRYLDLSYSRITNEGLSVLADCERLEVLHLAWTNIDDRGAFEIARFKSLQVVLLNGTQVTDVGLEAIARLPNIYSVRVYNSKATEEGIRRALSLAPEHCSIW